jgi:hypothetical protein
MMMADLQTSAAHCHHQNGARRLLRRHVKPKSEEILSICTMLLGADSN